MYYFFLILFTTTELVLLLAKRSRKSEAKSRSDGRSLLILWITIPSCLTLGNIASVHQLWLSGTPDRLEIFGISIYLIGFIIRWIAIFQLGRFFTVDVAISSDHRLKTNGLFRIVRHPSYLGLLLILAGLSLLLNYPICCLTIIPLFAAIIYRISVEEKALVAEFGNQYTEYSKQVKKIIPLIY